MKKIAIWTVVMISMVGCAYNPLEPSYPVDGDSYVFCPVDSEENARRALVLGQSLSMTETEFVQHLSEHRRTYRRLDSTEMECDDPTDAIVQSVYRVTGINSRRIRGSSFWRVYFVSIDEDGMVYQIEDRGDFGFTSG